MIAVLVGLPMMVIGQVLADRAQSDSRDTELMRVSAGASAGSMLTVTTSNSLPTSNASAFNDRRSELSTSLQSIGHS